MLRLALRWPQTTRQRPVQMSTCGKGPEATWGLAQTPERLVQEGICILPVLSAVKCYQIACPAMRTTIGAIQEHSQPWVAIVWTAASSSGMLWGWSIWMLWSTPSANASVWAALGAANRWPSDHGQTVTCKCFHVGEPLNKRVRGNFLLCVMYFLLCYIAIVLAETEI